MSDLTEFLLARLDGDAALARRGTEGFMGIGGGYGPETWHTVTCGTGIGYWANDECTCEVPARVLAEVRAKRTIVEDHNTTHAACPGSPTLTSDDGEQDGTYGGPCGVLRHLASVYADHPDYRDEWRP